MVVWVSGLIVLGAFTDPSLIPCTPLLPWQVVRSRTDAIIFPLDPSAPLLLIDEDTELELPDEEEEERQTISALGTARSRLEVRGHAASSNLAPRTDPIWRRLPVPHPRLVGVPLIYAFCSLTL